MNKLDIRSVRLKSQLYEKDSIINPSDSEETQFVVNSVLCKHGNPVACPICKKLMRNDKG
ncbi:unnamed protein product, partial [Brachionus calyciflorus]